MIQKENIERLTPILTEKSRVNVSSISAASPRFWAPPTGSLNLSAGGRRSFRVKKGLMNDLLTGRKKVKA